MTAPRTIKIREERSGADQRYLDAYVNERGLHLHGQDLGPAAGGEYEWYQTIAPEHVPRVVALLDGAPGEPILDLLERAWTQPGRSYELEKRLRESDIPVERFVR